MSVLNDYDILVIGGGHAGVEAAWAAANMLRETGGRVALITMEPDKIGEMSCNPAIGGLAKGQIVHEIDAMGGVMGLAIDATGIQFRVLNQSKGPAVRGPRAQGDKYQYACEVQRLLRTRTNLDVIDGIVDDIIVENGRCVGVEYSVALPKAHGVSQKYETHYIYARAVVLTTGTFMRGVMHIGKCQEKGGRVGELAAERLSDNLRGLGFELGRLKTGTPPRLAAETIDYRSLVEQPGDDPPQPFSLMTMQRVGIDDPVYQRIDAKFPVIEQVSCWITHTTRAVHDVIRANLDRAPLFNGQIHSGSVGPRYCPSIEDKVVRFADKSEHNVFLEPVSLKTNEIYCNGIPTSLPTDVQDYMVSHMPGCECATILQYGYAIEYDMVWPHQIDATCMTKAVGGLFLAGQINGSSGYEEAAGQGLLAGLNAVRYLRNDDLIRLRRDQAYIGVMMDDLVTKVPREPYRMFTSRSEHRLILRADNAHERLTESARRWGLIDDHRWAVYQKRRDTLEKLATYLGNNTHGNTRMLDWIKQPQVDARQIIECLDGELALRTAHDGRIIAAMLSDVRYAGFIDRHLRQYQRLAKLEGRTMPMDYDFSAITGLRNEAGQTLNRFRPATFGQASRLAGITPADLTVLALAIK